MKDVAAELISRAGGLRRACHLGLSPRGVELRVSGVGSLRFRASGFGLGVPCLGLRDGNKVNF